MCIQPARWRLVECQPRPLRLYRHEFLRLTVGGGGGAYNLEWSASRRTAAVQCVYRRSAQRSQSADSSSAAVAAALEALSRTVLTNVAVTQAKHRCCFALFPRRLPTGIPAPDN